MPAHSGEIIGKTVRRAAAIRRNSLFGIHDTRRDGRTWRACGLHGKVTHTDPQLLFSAAS